MKLLNKILLPVAGIATIAPAAITMTSCAKSHDLDGLNKKALEYAKVFQDATTKYTVDQIKATGKFETTGGPTIEFKDKTPDGIEYGDGPEFMPGRMCAIGIDGVSYTIHFYWNEQFFETIKASLEGLKNTWWESNGDLHVELNGTATDGGIKVSTSYSFTVSKYGYIKEQKVNTSYTDDGQKVEMAEYLALTYTEEPK